MRTLLAGLLLAAFLLPFSGCAALRQVVPYPDASLRGVDVVGADLGGIRIRFNVAVENPYDTALPVVGLAYDLSTGGTTFADGELELVESIPARGERVLPLTLRIPYAGLFELGDTVRPGSDLPYRAKLGLQVRTPVVGHVTLPLEDEGTLRIPALPR